MKVVIAPQSFKSGLSGNEVAKAIEEGVLRMFPDAETVRMPVADGGDGTLEVLVQNTAGESFTKHVTGPLGELVSASWGVMGDGKTVVIEMARASGLALVDFRHSDPMVTTSYGTGELIGEALDRGYRRMIVGLGGSATNDGGVGMAQALGVKFLDSNGRDLRFGGGALSKLARIDMSELRPSVMDSEIIAATDVSNPLCGPEGASFVYGPQKGASASATEELDQGLYHLGKVINQTLGVEVLNKPRAGAAGGMAAGLIAFLNARATSGIDLICEVLGLQTHLKGTDLVITGEGCVDGSTVFDKTPAGVARWAKAKGIPVIVMAGNMSVGYEEVYKHGIDAVVPIVDGPMTLQASVSRTFELVRGATERTMRLLKTGSLVNLPPEGGC